MHRILPFATLLLFVGCSSAEGIEAPPGEPANAEDDIVPLALPDETAPPSTRPAAPLDHAQTSLIDLRGVGDSGWSKTHEPTPIPVGFGAALDRFDRTSAGYRGDLGFINWETVVGRSCSRFGSAFSPGRSYAFVSRPENLVEAHDRGFNLIGLSNNHTRDCHASSETTKTGEEASPDMTAASIAGLGDLDWLTAGVGSEAEDDSGKARVHTFSLKGRSVRVAFGSLYMGRPDCPRAGCAGDAEALFASLRDAPADLRILALHSKAADDQDELVRKGVTFVERFRGDVVFGSGPHVWKPVRIVKKLEGGGGKGVVFESLGNFLHPALGAQSKNFIGRALFDPDTLALVQVQLLPVANAGMEVRWSSASASSVTSNLRWSALASPAGGVFANVAP